MLCSESPSTISTARSQPSSILMPSASLIWLSRPCLASHLFKDSLSCPKAACCSASNDACFPLEVCNSLRISFKSSEPLLIDARCSSIDRFSARFFACIEVNVSSSSNTSIEASPTESSIGPSVSDLFSSSSLRLRSRPRSTILSSCWILDCSTSAT